ncbi:MAG: hypothetical protein ABW120_00655 [Sedimenticola sp.]
MLEYRVILYHKHPASARTLFLLFSYESVCFPSAIPVLAQLSEVQEDNTVLHPAAVLNQVERELGINPGLLVAEPGYQHIVDVPGEDIHIILARIDSIDPPFETVEKQGGVFIDLTQARNLPQVELELLRFAYELVLGG